MANKMKCPNCGELLEPVLKRGVPVVPTHDFPRPCRAVCPGSGQLPREPSDASPLWKDMSDDQRPAG